MIKAVVNIDIGCYEQIQEPSFENPTWDFYTLTDLEGREHRKCTNEYFFEPVVVDEESLDGLSSKRKASYYKAKALSLLERETGIDYDIVIVIDGNIQITGDLDAFIDEYHNNFDISMTRHPDCSSYLHESQKIQEIKSNFGGTGVVIETEENMEETLDEMSRRGYKFNNGYHETGISIRSNTKRTKAFEKAWAKNYLQFATKRDQPSLAFTRWEKKSIQFNTIEKSILNISSPFSWHPHKYNKND
mgnify:CR=1 FL=1|tara:strand:+ start:126 stop:863 length:738 start_codon:yes stop_codon:yes gene_type:complete